MTKWDKGFTENYRYVFEENGQYGGSQNTPKMEPLKYAHIVRKYFNDYSDQQIVDLLIKLSTEGCGYVALANTIFLKYYGKEEEYKKTFGFNYRTEDGKLNFAELIVDFYCAMDNHNQYMWFDVVNPDEDKDYPKGAGTTTNSRKWRFEKYMKDKGLKVMVSSVGSEPSLVEKQMLTGPLIVSVRPTTLYDINGKAIHNSTGGHSMSVTGVAENGLIRVSSWGREYYIRHGSYAEHELYQQVIYK